LLNNINGANGSQKEQMQKLEESGVIEMKKTAKSKQIVVRFDLPSYNKISGHAEKEHRGLGELVRHAVLVYIEDYGSKQKSANQN